MLKLSLIGNLGSDATVREVGGQSVISFNVAHTESYTDRNGIKVERTTWVRCDYWRPSDRVAVAQYLKKGTQVYVEGTPSTRVWESQTGEWRASLECKVLDLKLLGSRSQSTGAPTAPAAAASVSVAASMSASPYPDSPLPAAVSIGENSASLHTDGEDDLPF